MNKCYILIPCFNEEENIKALLQEIKTISQDYRIVVINDCSQDNTIERASEIENITLLNLPINLGVGGAVQAGLRFALEKHADFAVKIDGDGQHDPSYIQKVLEPLLNNEADIIIGSRFLATNDGYKSTFSRRLGIKILQKLYSALTGEKITDPTSGLRAYNKKALEFMAENYPSFDYPEPEEAILAVKNGLRLKEIPVTMRERKNGRSSISPLGSIYYMIKVIISMIFIRLR